MVQLGNFFFRTRNYLFPVFYVFLFLPFTRITENYTTVFFIGLAIAIIGQLVRMLTIGLVYIVRGGRNRRIYADGLVTDGLFSHCRNPMYVGNILLIIGMSILSNSLFALLVMVPLYIFIYQAIVRAEEDFLRNSYGAGFETYCAKVNRWFPDLKGIGKTFSENDFNLKKVAYKEYNTSYLWMLGATLLLAYNTYWFQEKLTLENSGGYFLMAISILTLLYFTIRYFKKKEQRAYRERIAKEKPPNMKKHLILILSLFLAVNLSAQIDSTHLKPGRNLLKKSIVPLSLIATGIILSDSRFEKSMNTTTRNWVGNDFDVPVDDYTRYAPIAQMYIADIAGIKAKNHWFDQTKNLAFSMVLTDVITNFLKGRIYKVRPNDFNAKAFPSGHTSIAFSTGSVLYEEFKETSPILAYSGYGMASLTGAFRLMNNKHWVSDVLAGAGIGILVTKLVYHFDYLFKWNPFLKVKDISLVPRYSAGNVGFYFSKKF